MTIRVLFSISMFCQIFIPYYISSCHPRCQQVETDKLYNSRDDNQIIQHNTHAQIDNKLIHEEVSEKSPTMQGRQMLTFCDCLRKRSPMQQDFGRHCHIGNATDNQYTKHTQQPNCKQHKWSDTLTYYLTIYGQCHRLNQTSSELE